MGKTIGKYTVLETLDESGLGDVFLAEHPLLGRKVTVKVLRASERDEDLRERARQAARLVARLDHPGIETLYDFGETGGRPYFVLEYYEGRSLEELVERREVPPLLVTLRIMAAIAGALVHAHENGVVHRDVKPADIIISPKGEPVICNFLLAAPPSGDPLQKEGMVVGTPAYMSPEQARGGAVTPLVDIWNFGAALFHVLAGRPPYGGETVQEVLARAASPAPVDMSPLRGGAPEFVVGIIGRCLVKDPEKRYQSADELRRALEAAIDHVEVSQSETAELPPPREGQTLLLHVECQDSGLRGAYREYEIDDYVGGGRYGDVYRATEKLSRKALALKFLKREWVADADTVARFRREATILSRISHPNVVFVHNFGRYGPSFFMAMELLGKRTLCQVIEEHGPMDAAEAVAFFDPVLAGLAAVHEAGVVHRDLKPGNIAVLDDGGDGRIVIFDFGIAYSPDLSRLTTSGFFVGTPCYAAPEQASGHPVTGATDVYAAGVILYEMLSGCLPHTSSNTDESAYELLNRVVGEPPVPIVERRPDVPGAVREILDRMLAKKAEDRPAAAEVRRLLSGGL